MSSHLPSGFDERIRIFKSVLDEVYPRSFEDWYQVLENDGSPKDELLIWECIALTYTTFVESRALSFVARKEVLSILLQCSMCVPEEQLLNSPNKYLPVAAIQSLLTLYHASADATIAVDIGRQTSF